jgi:hypothetical protein
MKLQDEKNNGGAGAYWSIKGRAHGTGHRISVLQANRAKNELAPSELGRTLGAES